MRARSGRLLWLHWYGRSLFVLGACLLGGLMLSFASASLGALFGDGNRDDGVFVFQILAMPVTAAAYLLGLTFLAPRGRWPRLWAFALIPVFWGLHPDAALSASLPIGAMWLALLLFAAALELPPSRRERRCDGPLTEPERPVALGGRR